MKKEKKYALIEGFLDGSLSEKERADFEKEIEKSPKLKSEIALHREIAEVTGGEKFNDLRNVLKSTNAEWQAPNNNQSSGLITRFSFIKKAAAVAAVVLFSVLAWNIFNTKPATSQDIFAANFEPYEMVLTQRSGGISSELKVKWDDAISKYAEGNFTEAEKQFASLGALETNEYEPILKMYQGVSALAVGHHESAIHCFEGLLNVPNLQQQARWYLGLIYLKKDDSKTAKSILEKIKKGEYKFTEAQKIIN